MKYLIVDYDRNEVFQVRDSIKSVLDFIESMTQDGTELENLLYTSISEYLECNKFMILGFERYIKIITKEYVYQISDQYDIDNFNINKELCNIDFEKVIFVIDDNTNYRLADYENKKLKILIEYFNIKGFDNSYKMALELYEKLF